MSNKDQNPSKDTTMIEDNEEELEVSLKESREKRAPVRRRFLKLEADIMILMSKEVIDQDEFKVKMEELSATLKEIEKWDNLVRLALEKSDLDEEEIALEYTQIVSYHDKEVKVREAAAGLRTKRVTDGMIPTTGENKYNLPKYEVEKFSGVLTDWLRFWSNFEKIHLDQRYSKGEKFHHLMQHLEKGSVAYEAVSNYGQGAEFYDDAVKTLQRRFGNPDLLLEAYVGELLQLVIVNITSAEKMPMPQLYGKVVTYIRALNTLKLAQADPSIWFFPLVEGALPENVLSDWRRNQDRNSTKEGKNRLETLLGFMEKEVENCQRNNGVRDFADRLRKAAEERKLTPADSKLGNPLPINRKRKLVTTMGLHTADVRKCIFCQRTNHADKDCRNAMRMPYAEKNLILRKNGRCFICTGPHKASDCRNRNKLKCNNCSGYHVVVLCQSSSNGNTEQRPFKRMRMGEHPPVRSTMTNQVSEGDVCLQTLVLKIWKDGKEKSVRVLLDTASSRSYLTTEVAKMLKLDPQAGEKVIHATFGAKLSKPVSHKLYDLRLTGHDKTVHLPMKVRGKDGAICTEVKRVDSIKSQIESELKEKGVWLSDLEGSSTTNIDMLIGADYYGKIVTGRVVQLSNNLTAIETIFGWTLMGEVDQREIKLGSELNLTVIDNLVPTLWELEVLGIRDLQEVKSAKQKEELAKHEFLLNVSRDQDGRYIVKLPFIDGHPSLPTNMAHSKTRLENTSKKLKKEGLLKTYNDLFKMWETEGYIEQVEGLGRHYLPHRAVIKPGSMTTPVRPVFDASSKNKGTVSLNDCLHKGKSYIQLIPDILIRFREKEVGFVSDIKKAFQMIAVHEEDRDVLRFLWWKNSSMNEIKEFRHKRVPFGATCSPFILGAILEHHLKGVTGVRGKVARRLWNSLYVDNCCSSEHTFTEYENFKETAMAILKEAKMDLRMWMSNKEDLDNPDNRITSVLGVRWDRKTDELFVETKKGEIPEKVTKRVVLSVVSKLFDPIGFTSPVTLPMKILLQKAWTNKLSWDTPLPEKEANDFKVWHDNIHLVEMIRIPRLISIGDPKTIKWELHTFSDGSKVAFGTVSYLRVSNGNNVRLSLVSAKARVAPMKHLTIPRMELMGCVIAARTANVVKVGLMNDNIENHFWSDSTTALSWIKRSENWGTFVGNRISEIRALTNTEDWHFVPGIKNPADLPSRGCNPDKLLESRWIDGPEWLRLPKDQWPEQNVDVDERAVQSEQRKKIAQVLSNVELTIGNSIVSYRKLVRIHSWVRRFIHNCRNSKNRRSGTLSGIERKIAETDVILKIQSDAFDADLNHEKLKRLEVYKDERGVIRLITRLTYLNAVVDFRNPAVLPGDHETVKQLILEKHVGYCHAGVDFLRSNLRRKFWILKARKNIKTITSRCYRCRRFSSTPCAVPSAPLPLDRIKRAEVFETTGVDLAGPFTHRNGKKAWLVLFTCSVYRAIHLDMVNSISTVAFINSLKRFVEKYRRPVTVYSDNGTNFRGTDNLFKQIDWKKVQETENISQILWNFNPPAAPWWGGWWERLFRIIKDLMRKEIGNGLLCQEELFGVVKRIETIMNNRPLTYQSEDPNDLEPLTPSHFLHPLGLARFPEGDFVDGENLRKRYKTMVTIKEALKTRFLREYISVLVNRPSKKKIRPLHVGELVWIGQDNVKRGQWLLGRVLELIPGTDGNVRVANVKTKDGLLTRAIQRLHPLEADSKDSQDKFPTRIRGNLRRSCRSD